MGFLSDWRESRALLKAFVGEVGEGTAYIRFSYAEVTGASKMIAFCSWGSFEVNHHRGTYEVIIARVTGTCPGLHGAYKTAAKKCHAWVYSCMWDCDTGELYQNGTEYVNPREAGFDKPASLSRLRWYLDKTE